MESSSGAGAKRLDGGVKAERCLSHPVALRSRSLFSLRPFGAARPFSRRQEERGCKVQGSAGLPEVRRPSFSPCGCTHSLGGEQTCGSMGVGPPVGARGCGSAGRTLGGRTTVGVALTVFLMVEISESVKHCVPNGWMNDDSVGVLDRQPTKGSTRSR
jgi:hypothetical protein